MSPNDFYTSELPDDPELAFVELERQFRTELRGSKPVLQKDYNEYFSRVLGARDELQIDILKDYKPLSAGRTLHELETAFQFVQGAVERLRTRVKIRSLRRNKTYSARFDAATKQKVRHLLNQIKEIVDKVELDDRKKEALYSKINSLANEVDRDRTHFQAFGALVIEMAGIVGEAANKMEPARKFLDSIARCFGVAKSHEDANPQLPPHREPKKIEAPRKRLPAPKPDDDDVPF